MNQWSRYTNNQARKALTSFRKYIRSNEEEDLHELRVHLKKIKAALGYVRQHAPHLRKELAPQYHTLKRYFRQAGAVRAIGLRLNWLQTEGWSALAEASDSYRCLQRQQKKLFKNEKKYASVLRHVQKMLHAHADWGRTSAIKKYAFQLKQTVFLIALSGSSDDWHELRKTIKRLLYAMQWMDAVETKKIISKATCLKLERLQEQIGSWHDLLDHHNWMLQQGFLSSQNPALKELSAIALKSIRNRLRLDAQKVDLLLQETIPGLYD